MHFITHSPLIIRMDTDDASSCGVGDIQHIRTFYYVVTGVFNIKRVFSFVYALNPIGWHNCIHNAIDMLMQALKFHVRTGKNYERERILRCSLDIHRH